MICIMTWRLAIDFRFLQDSKLQSISADVFQPTQFIDVVDLRRNELQLLPEGIFDGLFNLGEM